MQGATRAVNLLLAEGRGCKVTKEQHADEREKPPVTRFGITRRIKVGAVTMYVTINHAEDGRALELFVKCDEGWQGWCDALSRAVSLGLQYGTPMDVLMSHWRGMRFQPDGFGDNGEGFQGSLVDAIARWASGDEYAREVRKAVKEAKA